MVYTVYTVVLRQVNFGLDEADIGLIKPHFSHKTYITGLTQEILATISGDDEPAAETDKDKYWTETVNT